eukprot:m.148001 g.148001  ORF g.148001 m.148001 type:complete len:716 (-) comp17786_c0_seq49:242-2389(-)
MYMSACLPCSLIATLLSDIMSFGMNLSVLDSENTLCSAVKEANLLQQLNHANIISYLDSFIEEGQFVCIVTEYCDGGDLSQMIYRQTENSPQAPFEEDQILDWLVQLLLALSYLHDRRILHRDIKSKNIFLKNIHGLPTTIAKLGDFGIARVLVNPADQASSLAGTPYYMSPECLRGQGYNTKSDVWSLGCVMFECCRRQLPFQADSLLGLTKQICDGTPPSLSSSFSLDLRVGLGLMLHRIPTNRPSASGLLQHPMMLPHIKRLDRTVADATLTRSQLHRESTRIREATDVSNFMSMPSNIREPAAKADGREYVVDGGNCADVTRETSRVLQMSPRERLAAKKLRAADERAKELVQGMESGTRETTDMRNRNRANAQWSDSGSAVLGVSTHNSLHVERGRGPQLSCDHSLSASREHSEPQTPPSADPWILEHPDIFPNGAPTLTMDKQGAAELIRARTESKPIASAAASNELTAGSMGDDVARLHASLQHTLNACTASKAADVSMGSCTAVAGSSASRCAPMGSDKTHTQQRSQEPSGENPDVGKNSKEDTLDTIVTDPPLHETLLAQHGINSPSRGPVAPVSVPAVSRAVNSDTANIADTERGGVATAAQLQGTNIDKLRALSRKLLPPDLFQKAHRFLQQAHRRRLHPDAIQGKLIVFANGDPALLRGIYVVEQLVLTENTTPGASGKHRMSRMHRVPTARANRRSTACTLL